AGLLRALRVAGNVFPSVRRLAYLRDDAGGPDLRGFLLFLPDRREEMVQGCCKAGCV
ncbi:hypothetical protein LTS18_002649, partial [Coniosporium uncinatum]